MVKLRSALERAKEVGSRDSLGCLTQNTGRLGLRLWIAARGKREVMRRSRVLQAGKPPAPIRQRGAGEYQRLQLQFLWKQQGLDPDQSPSTALPPRRLTIKRYRKRNELG